MFSLPALRESTGRRCTHPSPYPSRSSPASRELCDRCTRILPIPYPRPSILTNSHISSTLPASFMSHKPTPPPPHPDSSPICPPALPLQGKKVAKPRVLQLTVREEEHSKLCSGPSLEWTPVKFDATTHADVHGLREREIIAYSGESQAISGGGFGGQGVWRNPGARGVGQVGREWGVGILVAGREEGGGGKAKA